MSGLRSYMRRHILWVGFLAVLVPMAVLLTLQYRWLDRLKRTSSVAEEAATANYVERVTEKIEYFYRHNANTALRGIGPSLFEKKVPHKAAGYFRERVGEIDGIAHLFVSTFVAEPGVDDSPLHPFFATTLFYNAETNRMEHPAWANAFEAVTMAIAPYRVMLDEDVTMRRTELVVDEMDPDNRIILEPVVTETGRIVGVKGVVLDTDYFQERVFPRLMAEVLPDSSEAEHFILLDPSGRSTSRDRPKSFDGADFVIERGLPWIFTDWSLQLHQHGLTPERWARSNFHLNLALSALVALVLLGGIAIALRVASREMKLSRMKADFVSNVSHELRTPLASIRVFGEFLRLGRVDGPDRIRDYGEFIETESRRLTQLINNILDFSKIESNAKTYRFERHCPEAVVERILKTFKVRLEHAGFELRLEMPEEPLPEIPMDSQAVGQALNNLLDNAVKYSGDEKVITVRVARTRDHVTFAVGDRGIGITRAEQRKIFERFHRAGSSLVHDTKGSGLGLSIVNHIVAAHHGKITVESEPGKGSTFIIHLPDDHPSLAERSNPNGEQVGLEGSAARGA